MAFLLPSSLSPSTCINMEAPNLPQPCPSLTLVLAQPLLCQVPVGSKPFAGGAAWTPQPSAHMRLSTDLALRVLGTDLHCMGHSFMPGGALLLLSSHKSMKHLLPSRVQGRGHWGTKAPGHKARTCYS